MCLFLVFSLSFPPFGARMHLIPTYSVLRLHCHASGGDTTKQRFRLLLTSHGRPREAGKTTGRVNPLPPQRFPLIIIIIIGAHTPLVHARSLEASPRSPLSTAQLHDETVTASKRN